LQLIVSIQGLILGEEFPYYLEANYEHLRGQKQAHIASLLYNENALLATMQLTLSSLTTLPNEYSALVQAHFNNANVVKDFKLLYEAVQTHIDSANQHSKQYSAEDVAIFRKFGIRVGESFMVQKASIHNTTTTGSSSSITASTTDKPDEEKQIDSSNDYYPSVGFLFQLSRYLTQLVKLLSRNSETISKILSSAS
jgi:hypothetical protein